MAITAVVIDSEPTFADALAIRLDAEADITAQSPSPPSAGEWGWGAGGFARSLF
jgi:hypothetical protein